MKVLVACEFSGAVREAFRALGHDAWSCDLLPTEILGQHIQDDVLKHLDEGWNLMIAHPPCTHHVLSANRWLYQLPKHPRKGVFYGAERFSARERDREFVRMLFNAPIPHIAIENPMGTLQDAIGPYTQSIQPYEFGENASKTTWLWLKNLPLLQPTQYIQPRIVNGKRRWSNQTDGSGANILPPSDTRWLERSRTYQGIADAMAAQWGDLNSNHQLSLL